MTTPAPAGIHVAFTIDARHSWPDAPAGAEEHLRHPHEHRFTIRVATHVTHDDRELTFEALERSARAAFPEGSTPWQGHGQHVRDLGPQSCETLARIVATRLASEYARTVTAQVDEDDRRGATVTITPEL